jgi:hypothetical protein
LISNAAVQSANIAALVANAGVQADVITSLTANAGVQSANIATLVANAGVQADAIASLQANITAANLAIAAASGTYSNTNVAAYLSASTTGNVGAGNLTVVNNFSTNVISANSFTYANGASILDGIGGTYSNSNVSAYLSSQNITTANIGGLYDSITAANTTIQTLSANVGGFYTWANTNFGTSSYGDANVAAYLTVNPQGTTYTNSNVASYLSLGTDATVLGLIGNTTASNAAIVTANTAMKGYVDAVTSSWTAANTIQSNQITGANAAIITANSAVVSYVNTQTNSLATGANANVLAYLTSGFTVSGNITAGNIITSGPVSGNISNVNIVSANSVQLTSNLTVSGVGTIGGNLYVLGNLQVSGTTTTVSQATLSVTDKIITVSNGSTTGSQANGAGLSVAGSNANLYYTSIGDQWNTNKPFYAPGIYDGAARVVSTSSGAGNLTISGTGVNLTSMGPGAVITGSATAIPVITTDAYGRISGITTAAVSSTLNTAGTTGTGTVNLTSQSLSVTGTNGITATASGQTITITDNLWPAANANLGTATTNITALQANIGSYYIWANANVAGLSSQITGANAAIITANTALKNYTDNQITTANSAVVSYVNTKTTSLATGANTNTAAYLAANISTNIGTTGTVYAGNIIVNGQPTTYGVVNPAYMVVGLASSIVGFGVGSTVIFDTVVGNVNSQTSYNTSTGVFTLTAGVTYDMSFTPSFIGLSNTTSGFMCYDWVDATTNALLDTTGIGTGTSISSQDTTAQQDNATARIIYKPTTNQTVKLRVSNANGTVTLRGGIGTQAIVRPLNLSIAVQATATGTVAATIISNTSPNLSSFSNGTSTNPATTLFTLSIPSAGTWQLESWVRTYSTTGTPLISGGFYTGGTLVTNSETLIWPSPVTTANGAGYMSAVVTTVGAATYTVGLWSSGTGVGLYNDSTGRTKAQATKLDSIFALNALDTMSLTGNITTSGNVSATGNVTANAFVGSGSGLTNVAQQTTGSWSVTAGTNTYSFTVPANATYAMWVRGNIPNGIIAWNATATVTNTNVPIVGQQFAWVYNGAGTPLDFVSIPNQFTGTGNAIVRSNVSPSITTNRFDFSINNTSGNTQIINYVYTTL